jgi:hypothetical protein
LLKNIEIIDEKVLKKEKESLEIKDSISEFER